jgi:cytochrome c peroxidase
MSIPRGFTFLLSLVVVAGCSDNAGPGEGFPDPRPFTPDTEGLRPFPEFPDNPLTREGVALGRRLFHDPILSLDHTQSCASCHDQAHAFSDPRRFSEGVDGSLGTRNAPALANAAWLREFFWAGRAPSLEDQAREPVPNPIEMALPWDEAIPRLTAHAEYPELFGRAFGTIEIDEDRVVKAIAQFERTLISNHSRYDRHLRGELELTTAESRGERLFFNETGECFHCHGTLFFTDEEYHDNGLDLAPVDPGRQAVTGREPDHGKFRTPTLRNIEHTAPYMHDGRFDTLEQVMDHYSSGVQPSPNLDAVLRVHGPPGLSLTEPEKADLIAFLKTLSDLEFLENPDFGPE